jgi:hypothetical protein
MHVVTTMLEHNSVLRVVKTLERRGVITLSIVAPSSDGTVRPEHLVKAVTARTGLVILTHASMSWADLTTWKPSGPTAAGAASVFWWTLPKARVQPPSTLPPKKSTFWPAPGIKGFTARRAPGFCASAPGLP